MNFLCKTFGHDYLATRGGHPMCVRCEHVDRPTAPVDHFAALPRSNRRDIDPKAIV